MSNEMTAEELKRLSALRILNEAFKDQPRVNHLEDTQVPLVIDAMLNHSKEAVKEFAEELIGSGAMYYGQVPAVSVNEIKELAKQKGVDI